MRKYRKFTQGGATDPLEEYNKGENLDTTPGPKARRDSEEVTDEMGTSSKFRRNLETGDLYSEEPITRPSAPKAKPKPKAAAPAPSPAPSPSPAPTRAEVPKASASAAPASTGKSTSGPSNMDRILMGVGAGSGVVGIAGAAKLAQMWRAEKAAETAKAAAAKFSQPQARQIATQTGVKKQPVEQVKKEPPTPAKDSAATASPRKSRNIFERPPKKSDTEIARTGSTGAPRSRNTVGRDEEMTGRNFSSGGKIRGGGCEMRGKTKGRMV